MKKRYVISLIAIMLVVVSFLAMSTAATPSDGFRVGWSKIEIAPKTANGDRYDFTQLGLAGYGDTDVRRAKMIDPEFEVYANCIAATDEYDNTVMFISLDLINSHYYLVEHARDAIYAATGVPEKNIMFSASHTHSSVSVTEVADINASMRSIAANAISDYAENKAQYDAKINALVTESDRLAFATKYFTDAEYMNDYTQAEIDMWYRDTFLVGKLVDLCKAAMSDRKKVQSMSMGEVEITSAITSDGLGELNYNRHYWGIKYGSDSEKVAVGDNHNDRSSTTAAEKANGIYPDYRTDKALESSAEYTDNNLQLVRFVIEGRDKPVVMMKWIAHPCLMGSVNRSTVSDYTDSEGNAIRLYDMLSPDYVGAMRTSMWDYGFDTSFFQGAAGNINAYVRGDANDTYVGYENYKKYGNELARIANQALNDSTVMREIEPGMVQVDYYRFDDAERFDHSGYKNDPDLAKTKRDISEEIRNTWLELQKTMSNAAARYQARDIASNLDPRLVHSVYHAGSIKSNYDAQVAGTFDPNMNLSLNAVSIGREFSMVTAPGEVFDVLYMNLQKEMQEYYTSEYNLSDKKVFTVGYSNSRVGYIPALYAYDTSDGGTVYDAEKGIDYRDYLTVDKNFCTYETDTTSCAPGVGEQMVQHQITMLKKQAVVAEAEITTPELVYCECDGIQPEGHACEAVLWENWTSNTTLPSETGNYRLTTDVTLNGQINLDPEVVIRLDLNGHTVTQSRVSSAGEVCVYNTYVPSVETYKNRTIVITDSSDDRDGKIIGSNSKVRQGGIIRGIYADVCIYAGTLDASGYESIHRDGGAAVMIGNSGSLKMYGGKIIGGTAMGLCPNTDNPPVSDNPAEGGAVSIQGKGKMYMYGGTITGGVSDFGGGIYVSASGKLHLYGDANVTGNFGDAERSTQNNIYLENAESLTVHESFTGNCGITISGGASATAPFGISDSYNLAGTIIADDNQTLVAGLSGSNLVWIRQDILAKNYDAAGNLLGEYLTLSEAIDGMATDGSQYVKLAKDVTENVTLTHDAYIDLAGFDISGDVTIADGATLYCMDSTTDDYDCSDDYGKITGRVSGTLADYTTITKSGTKYTYIWVKEEVSSSYVHSYHRVHMRVKTMNLKANRNGMYYGCEFAGDSVVKRNLYSFGVAFSLQDVPVKESMTNPLTYTAYTRSSFIAGLNADGTVPNGGNGTLIYDVVSTSLPNFVNRENAAKPIYGVAYISTTQGAMAFGDPVSYSFQWLVEAVDSQWEAKIADGSLPQTEIGYIVTMYNTYKQFMQTWNIPNIKAAAAK